DSFTLSTTIDGSYFGQVYFFSMLFGGGGGNQRGGVNPLIVIVALITAPLAAMLLQLAISRSRESKADLVGAKTIQDPNSLADALEKLEIGNQANPMTTGSPASSSLYIVNPFRGSSLSRLFSTHPPTADRVRALRAMAADHAYRPAIRSPSFPPRLRPSHS
ncbi:MAG: M48 family metalloprotease, partial [Thermoplasmata archaeon]|nr:M48 family metalloprotease [Thermoplasmata archaeon]